MLQGKSKIELFDALTGKKTFEHEEHNMITNAYKKAYETAMSKLTLTDDFSSLNKLSPQQISKSILLLNSTQTADVNNFVPKGTLIGYASENGYSGSSSMRGNFNSTESVPLSNPSGYKYVWDFPTNCANGTISALSLVPSETIINSPPSIVSLSSSTVYKNGVFSDETGDNFYIYYYGSGNYGFTKSTLKSTIPYLTSASRFATATYTFAGYNSGMSNIVYSNGYVYLILKQTSDSKWYLIKSDTNGNTVSTTLIGTAPVGNYWGIVGNYVIWGHSNNGNSLTLRPFNITTGVLASDIIVPVVTVGSLPSTVYNIGTSLLFMYGNYYNAYYSILIDEILNIMRVGDEINSCNFPYTAGTGNFIAGAPIVIGSSYVNVSPFTMFTINNLQTAVNKTTANTMKISYSLTWS